MPGSKAKASATTITAPGEIETVNISDPPAGGELSVTVPDYEIWHLNLFRMQMTTDSTNTTRTVQLIFESPGGIEMFRVEVAGKGQDETFQIEAAILGFDPADIGNRLRECLPNRLWLPAGAVIKTETENIQTGDQFSGAIFFVEKFPSNYTEK